MNSSVAHLSGCLACLDLATELVSELLSIIKERVGSRTWVHEASLLSQPPMMKWAARCRLEARYTEHCLAHEIAALVDGRCRGDLIYKAVQRSC